MALTPSRMAPLGTAAPAFCLAEPKTGHTVTLDDVATDKDAVLVMFICNHCPFVVHVNPELVRLANDYLAKNVGVVAISSNSVATHPQDGPAQMATHAEAEGYPFPYLFDEDQSTALAYEARCTPDFFLYDKDRKLAYRGQLDASRPGNGKPLDGADLRAAIDTVLSGKAIEGTQYPSAGCNIKWAPGNEPE